MKTGKIIAVTVALMSVLGTSALAATYDAGTGKVSATTKDLSSYSGEVAAIIIKKGVDETNLKDSDLYFIDQETAGTSNFQNMGVKGGALEDGTYLLKIGGENVPQIIVEEFTVGETPSYILGDVNKDTFIDSLDVTAIRRHVKKTRILTDPVSLLAADVNEDTFIDSLDATKLKKNIKKASSK